MTDQPAIECRTGPDGVARPIGHAQATNGRPQRNQLWLGVLSCSISAVLMLALIAWRLLG